MTSAIGKGLPAGRPEDPGTFDPRQARAPASSSRWYRHEEATMRAAADRRSRELSSTRSALQPRSKPREGERPPRSRAAALAAAAFIGMAGFEIALALGAPLGRAAWGGANAHLQPGLRIASVGSAALLVFAALIVLGRVGSRLSPLPAAFTRRGTWVLVGVLTLGTLMNFASPSVWERFLQAPIALVMAVLCFVVARGGFPPEK